MQIEEGKYYWRADGRLAGPATRSDIGGDTYPWNVSIDNWFYGYTEDGRPFTGRENERLVVQYGVDEVGDTPATNEQATNTTGFTIPLLDEDEPDATLKVAITADTTNVDAQIDRIKKRLKKLVKRAKRYGIDLRTSELRDA